jgi:hypothetical protein
VIRSSALKSICLRRLGTWKHLVRRMRFIEWKAMLRITVHEEGGHCRLELAGKLGGPWVAETENVWLSAPCSGKEIEVDMREVTGVDDAGRELLAAMHRAGACFTAKGVAMTTLIAEITGEPLNATERQLRKKVLPNNEDSRTRRHTK